MIYIDTRDQLSLKHGVMEFLNVTEEELELVFETIDSVDEDPYDWVKKYLEDYGIDSPLEYIQMFHLTRRLNGTDLRTNNNLERLLLCKTPLSDFFKRYDVTFKKHKHASFVCDENLILRLDDSTDIKRDWFVNAEEIDL